MRVQHKHMDRALSAVLVIALGSLGAFIVAATILLAQAGIKGLMQWVQ